jgi:hypothetical protein
MELCDICVGTAKRISNIISSWDPNHPHPPEPELEIYESDESQRPLPRDSIQHLSRAGLLPRSASYCPFCELIRSSLVFAYFQKFGPREEGFKLVNYDNKYPIADILGDVERNKFLGEPLYSSSPIYLQPVQGNGLYRGIAPKDGYYLQSIKVILRPTPYNKTNMYHALENVQLVAFSDFGKLLATILHFCQTLIDFQTVLLAYQEACQRENRSRLLVRRTHFDCSINGWMVVCKDTIAAGRHCLVNY